MWAGNKAAKASSIISMQQTVPLSAGVLIVIPVRGGSKRLPAKHSRLLRGHTLLERTNQAIRMSGLSAPCLLTTDDPEIAAAGQNLGWLAPFLRPASLSTDSASSVDAVLHAVDWYTKENGADPKLIMLLQTTSPLRSAAVLHEGVALLVNDESLEAVVSMTQVQTSPANVYTQLPTGHLQSLGQPDNHCPVFAPNGALYVIRTSSLRTHRTFVPPATRGILMSNAESIDIDTQQDWNMAEAILDFRITRMVATK